MTISTVALLNTDATDLGEHQAKPTAVTPNMTEASHQLWSNTQVDTGLWECTPGTFTAERIGYTEICTVLSGSVTLEVEGEEPVTFGPGDVMVMPSGWKGVWQVHEPLRKHYTTIDDVPAA